MFEKIREKLDKETTKSLKIIGTGIAGVFAMTVEMVAYCKSLDWILRNCDEDNPPGVIHCAGVVVDACCVTALEYLTMYETAKLMVDFSEEDVSDMDYDPDKRIY